MFAPSPTLDGCQSANRQSKPPYLGLAPYLRLSIAGADLRPIARQMLERAQSDPDDANLLMNLSTAMFCLQMRDMGMVIQAQALALERIYRVAASTQPPRLRLLMLMAPGDLSANTPLDCLLEGSDIELQFYFVTPGNPLAEPVPEHDVLMVSLSESEDNRGLLALLEPALCAWPKPVINAPGHIPATGRIAASQLLHQAPGVLIPPTLRASRAQLLQLKHQGGERAVLLQDCDFPLIVRPVDSHGGHGLDRLAGPEDIANYLHKVEAADFFLSPFIDYSGADGLFRKYRIALIDGKPFACHMAVSSHWMIHYLNANMYADPRKREEEAAFMANFADTLKRHGPALDAIYRRTRLDYVCVDCAEAPDGRLLVFEIDHAMVVHAMDPVELFPYKQQHMRKVQNAFRDFLVRLTDTHKPGSPARTDSPAQTHNPMRTNDLVQTNNPVRTLPEKVLSNESA